MEISVNSNHKEQNSIHALDLGIDYGIITSVHHMYDQDLIGSFCFKPRPEDNFIIIIIDKRNHIYYTGYNLNEYPIYCRPLEAGEKITITIQN